MGVSTAGRSDGGGGITGGGDLFLPPPEHSHTVHCDQDHYVPVSISVESSGVMGVKLVVGKRRIGPGRDLDRGLGRGMGKGRGRRRTGQRQRLRRIWRRR